MKWEEALEILENGGSVYREDWGYSEFAYLELIEFIWDYQFYITGAYSGTPKMQEAYGITYPDLISDEWEQVED